MWRIRSRWTQPVRPEGEIRTPGARATATLLLAFAASGCGITIGEDESGDASGGSGGPPPPNEPSGTLAEVTPGDTVGVFEVEAGLVQHFPLHGTLPIPKGTFPRPDGKMPFVIVDPDENAYATQTEIVSRYPNPADGADVVELLARVSLPASAAPGTRVRYEVMYSPLDEEPLTVAPDVTALFATPEAITLRTRDCFGNEYTADLLEDVGSPESELLKYGAVCKQWKTHENLLPTTPVVGPAGTLPHMMGAHAYVTQWSTDTFVSLDLRVHNGHSGLDGADETDDPLGKIYFQSLELRVPVGWSVMHTFDNPYVGAPVISGGWKTYPIVAPIGNGTFHMMPQQAQFHRRLVVYRDGYDDASRSLLDQNGLGLCRAGDNENGDAYYSWWNPWTARYFPQNVVLPDLSHVGESPIRTDDANHLAAYTSQVASGSTGIEPVPGGNMGWAHAYGVPYGGVHGGTEIWLYDGVTTAWAASHDGYRLGQLVHRMKSERQPTALYNGDGEPTQHDQWIVQGSNGPYMPAWMFMRPILESADPFGFNSSPDFQRDYVENNSLTPSYESSLLGYGAIDLEHLIRYTRLPKVLTWLGNDSLAKDDLRMEAELFHFSYNMLPQSNNGAVIGTGLLYDTTYTQEHPGWGVKFGRAEGWGLDTMTAYYSVASPAWRDAHRAWFGHVIDMLQAGQSACTGTITTSSMGHMFGGQYRNRQSIEACIVENAMWGMARTVYQGYDESRRLQTDTVLRDAIYSMISYPVWNADWSGPSAMLAMGPYDANQPPFCNAIMPDGQATGPDRFQVWSNYAYGFWLSNDHEFLNKGADMAFDWRGNPDLLSMVEGEGLNNLNNMVALLSLLQAQESGTLTAP